MITDLLIVVSGRVNIPYTGILLLCFIWQKIDEFIPQNTLVRDCSYIHYWSQGKSLWQQVILHTLSSLTTVKADRNGACEISNSSRESGVCVSYDRFTSFWLWLVELCLQFSRRCLNIQKDSQQADNGSWWVWILGQQVISQVDETRFEIVAWLKCSTNGQGSSDRKSKSNCNWTSFPLHQISFECI